MLPQRTLPAAMCPLSMCFLPSLHWQPTHKALNCPCNYQPKTSPSHPHNPPLCHLLWISKKNSFSSTGSLNQATTSRQGKMVKKPHLTDFKIIPVPSLEGKGKKKEENPTFGNDNAITNNTGEPYGHFWFPQWKLWTLVRSNVTIHHGPYRDFLFLWLISDIIMMSSFIITVIAPLYSTMTHLWHHHPTCTFSI